MTDQSRINELVIFLEKWKITALAHSPSLKLIEIAIAAEVFAKLIRSEIQQQNSNNGR